MATKSPSSTVFVKNTENFSAEEKKEIQKIIKIVGEAISLGKGQRKNLICIEVSEYTETARNSAYIALKEYKYAPMFVFSETDDSVRLYIGM